MLHVNIQSCVQCTYFIVTNDIFDLSYNYFKMLKIGIGTIIGLTGGITIERYRKTLWQVDAAKKFTEEPKQIMPNSPEQQKGGTIAYGSGRFGEITKHGFPSFDSIRTFDNFVLSYDRRNRTAAWVLEHISPKHFTGQSVDRSNINFFEDLSIHHYFRSTNDDYKGSGYDRGHLAAAGNHRVDSKLITQTFVLSNVSPQVGKGFNRDAWNKLEKYCRWKANKVDNLYVCTGPLYLPRKEANGKMYVKYEVIGKNHVSVPTHFFKILLMETKGEYDIEAYVMPNQVIDQRIPLESFQVPIDTIERAAGLLFFDRTPKDKIRTINGKIKYT